MKRFFLLALGLAVVGIGLSIIRPPFLETLDRKFYDIHFALRGPIPTSDRIVLTTIDEKSLQELGRWPWPRSLIARIFEAIVSEGAKAVVPDIFFAEPSRGALGTKNDEALAQTLHRHPNIYMGYFFLLTPEEFEESSVGKETLERNFRNLGGSALPFDFRPPVIREGVGLQDTLPIFSDLPGGRRHGFFNILNDPDGTVRATPLLMAYRGKVFPSLLLQAAMADLGRADLSYLNVLGLDRRGDFLVNYRGPGSVFPRVSIQDLLGGEPPISLEDKIVLVGATAAGLEDNRPTPVDPTTPSVVLAAHLLDNLIRGDFLKRDRFTDLLSWSFILVAGFLFGFAVPRMKAVPAFLLFTAYLALEAVLIHVGFVRFRLVLQNVYPLFSTFLIYGGTSLYDYLAQEKEKHFIRETFERYLSPDVIHELTEHPEKIRLGGERKELTVFFSDIRDFATIVETTPAEVLVDLLNSYLTPVTEVIFEQRGMLDKYIGDAVMAVFGAPLAEPEHPRLACQAAVDIVRLVNGSGGKWEKEFHVPRLKIGIGINTGLMTVGNMGSERRFDYTVIGDAVNTASRIEGLNRFYGTTVLISQATYERVGGGSFPFREIDTVQVKGKKETIRIYELLVDPPFAAERLLPVFSEGLRIYRGGAFAEARSLFEKCLSLAPGDGPSRLFLERCRQMEANPPKDWEGVTTFLRK